METDTKQDPIVETFMLLSKSMIASDDALFTLCNALVIRVNQLAKEIEELHTQMDIMLYLQDSKKGGN